MVAERIESAGLNLEEKVVYVWRCSKVVKGGRRFSFSAITVVGNGNGIAGMGYGKGREVPLAIEKAVKDAKKHLIRVETYGTTIPHEVRGKFGAAEVVIIPALPGTGVIAGGAVRAVLESIGVRDVLTKSVGGTNNAKNLVKATFDGLVSLRSRAEIADLRGVAISEDPVLQQSLRITPERQQKFQQRERDERPRRRGRGRKDEATESTSAAPAVTTSVQSQASGAALSEVPSTAQAPSQS